MVKKDFLKLIDEKYLTKSNANDLIDKAESDGASIFDMLSSAIDDYDDMNDIQKENLCITVEEVFDICSKMICGFINDISSINYQDKNYATNWLDYYHRSENLKNTCDELMMDIAKTGDVAFISKSVSVKQATVVEAHNALETCFYDKISTIKDSACSVMADERKKLKESLGKEMDKMSKIYGHMGSITLANIVLEDSHISDIVKKISRYEGNILETLRQISVSEKQMANAKTIYIDWKNKNNSEIGESR